MEELCGSEGEGSRIGARGEEVDGELEVRVARGRVRVKMHTHSLASGAKTAIQGH